MSVTVLPLLAEPAVIVYVPVDVAIAFPLAFEPSNVVKVKLSDPGGTSGPATAHGAQGGVTVDVTLVVKPIGGKLPSTVFSVICTEAAPAPT